MILGAHLVIPAHAGVTISISARRSRCQSTGVPTIICANTTPRNVAQITSATPSLAWVFGDQLPSWLIAAFIFSRCRRDEPPGPPVGPQDLECRHRRRAAVAAPRGVDDDLDALSHRQLADIGRGKALQQLGHPVVDDGHQQAVAVAEVILDHSPGDARAFGDVLRGCGGEALLHDAAHGLVDDLRARVVAALAWRACPSGGTDGRTGLLACRNRHC